MFRRCRSNIKFDRALLDRWKKTDVSGRFQPNPMEIERARYSIPVTLTSNFNFAAIPVKQGKPVCNQKISTRVETRCSRKLQ